VHRECSPETVARAPAYKETAVLGRGPAQVSLLSYPGPLCRCCNLGYQTTKFPISLLQLFTFGHRMSCSLACLSYMAEVNMEGTNGRD
jgi:hypothetical protein